MYYETLLDTLNSVTQHRPETILCKNYFFHDVRITCQTNHPTVLDIFDGMLALFPEPEHLRGEATYYVLCYDSISQFPIQLPRDSIRTETVRLLTNTRLKYYRSKDYTTEYQSYGALANVNQAALSIIQLNQRLALTQLAPLACYQTTFLRRYIFLLALGQLMRQFDFEPCHAASVTAPWDTRQGALIVGASGTGKTTLSLGCVCEGYSMLGDDLVMLRQNENAKIISALAITHEISVRSASLDLWQALSFLRSFPEDLRGKRYCTIDQVQPGVARIETPIRLLLFPTLTSEAKSTVTPLTKASALQELVDQCMTRENIYPQAQERLFFLLSALAEQAPGYKVSIARGANDGPGIVSSLFSRGAL